MLYGLTTIAHRWNSPVDGALESRTGSGEVRFTVNIGISTNKLLAKMASDFEKPDRVHTLFPEEIKEKMWPLPISELYMAGRSSAEVLKKLEINTIGDLAQSDLKLIMLHLKSHGKMLLGVCKRDRDGPDPGGTGAGKRNREFHHPLRRR